MKKLLLVGMIIIIGITVGAADVTKEEYLAKRKAADEKNGRPFNEKGSSVFFDKQDLNKDGILSDEEQAAHKVSLKANAGAKKAKPATE